MRNFPQKIIIAFALGMVLSPITALAEDTKPATIPCVPHLPCISRETQQTKGGVRDFITNVFAAKFFTTFLALVGVTSVIFIIVGGFQMHVALGNEEAIKKAKTTITWAVVGLVFAILSVSIVNIVSNLFNAAPK